MYIQLEGQILSYEKDGEGSPVILLHGNGESHEIFDVLSQQLTKNHTVYAIDSRGQGGSATPNSYHYKDMAKDVILFITSLEIEKPSIIGFSDGGVIALLVAMERSDLLSSIVVCGANLSPKGLKGSALREIKKLYKKNGSPLVQMMLVEPNINESELQKISVPTLICAGDDDMIKPKETEKIFHNMPGAKGHIFKNATHSRYVEHSDALMSVLPVFWGEE